MNSLAPDSPADRRSNAPARFDRVARIYRYAEHLAFGSTLQHARTAQIRHAAHSQRVLIIGEGDGRFLASLRTLNPSAHVTVIDTSRTMLKITERRTAHLGPTEYIQADVRTTPLPAAKFDLIVTHFLLDCFSPDDAARIATALAAAATTDARWLVAEFETPAGGAVARFHAALWLAAMRAFFRLSTGLAPQPLPEVPKLLQAHGFSLLETRSYRLGLLTSAVWQRGKPLASASQPVTLPT